MKSVCFLQNNCLLEFIKKKNKKDTADISQKHQPVKLVSSVDSQAWKNRDEQADMFPDEVWVFWANIFTLIWAQYFVAEFPLCIHDMKKVKFKWFDTWNHVIL